MIPDPDEFNKALAFGALLLFGVLAWAVVLGI